MAYKRYTFRGLGREVILPDYITVEQKYITNSRFWSNQKTTGHTTSTVHDTGNPKTLADGEWNWANNGRSGAGVGGYNGIFDAKKLIISQAFNEVVWHAGTPLGNATSYGFEMAYGGGQKWEDVYRTGTWVHAAILEAKGWYDVEKALVLHQKWYGKYCAAQILNRKAFAQFKIDVQKNIDALRKERTGVTTTTPAPVVKASPIKELAAYRDTKYGLVPAVVTVNGVDYIHTRDVIVTTQEISEYMYADKSSTVKKAPKATQYVAEFMFKYGPEGKEEWFYYTSEDTRVLVAGTTRVSDTPKQED